MRTPVSPGIDPPDEEACTSRVVLARALELVTDMVVVHDGVTVDRASVAAARLWGEREGGALAGRTLAELGLSLSSGGGARLVRPPAGELTLAASTRVAEVDGRRLNVTVLRQSPRQAGALLRESQRLAQLGSWELDLASGELHWSDEIYRIFEIDPLAFDASYRAFLERVHPDDRATVDDAYGASVRNRTTYELTHRLLMPDGRVKHVLERGETVYGDDGRALRSIGTVQDVTARVQMEQQLRLRNQALATSLAAIAFADLEGRLTSVNAAFLKLWRYDTEGEVLGRHATSFWERPPLAQAVLEGLLANGSATGELVGRRSDGTTFVAQLVASVSVEPDGRPTGIMSHFVDVTARVRAEATLEDQVRRVERELKEKELLLQEVHHRVKNNMQVISSLLFLQQEALGEGPAADALRDSAARVSAMALVHEKLYATRDFTQVDLASYARDLGLSLLSSFALDPSHVSLEVRGEATLPVDVAVPCGLILNELISNSCKHAFPGEGRGRIGVQLAERDGAVHLHICDDGVGGVPDDAAPQTLGLRLLPRIAAQMGATLAHLPREPGTCFTLVIPRRPR